MDPKSNSNRYRWYFPLTIALTLIMGVSTSFFIFHKIDTTNRNLLIYRTDTIANAIDVADIKSLKGDELDLSSLQYQHIKEKLIAFRKANPDSRFVYLVGRRPAGETFFFVDSEDPVSEDYSPPGQVYFEESGAFDLAFKRTASTEGPISDRWGRWISGAAPIFDPLTHEVIAVAGVDIDATLYIQTALAFASIPLLVALFFVVFTLAGMKMRKQEEHIYELKAQFVAIASHELRSPLTGVRWGLLMLLKEQIVEAHKKTLRGMLNNVERLNQTIDDILNASSFDSHKSLMTFVDISLKSLVDGAVRDLSMMASEKALVFRGVDSISADITIVGEASSLSQVMNNVLSNAIKYSNDKGEIEISAHIEKNTACLLIHDHGIGIPKDELSKIYDGFYRASNAKKLNINGSGLGLHIVKKIIEAHKGSLSIDSSPGYGTLVKICLPLSKKL